MTKPKEESVRRDFLRRLGSVAMASVLADERMNPAEGSSSKLLRGIFPVAQTPFTESGKLDLEALIGEVKFIDRSRVHGFVWPQNASEWRTLTDRERFEGAEAIASIGKQLRPAIVIGVQGPDVATAIKYAKHAQHAGADAIISLPPSENRAPNAVLDFYRQVGTATELPMFVQSVGNLSVDLILEMFKAIPTLRYVKDESGNPLARVALLREKSSNQIKVFSGTYGRALIDEMRRGLSGSMPAASFADLYAATWDLWHTGHHQEAMEMHGKTLLILTEVDINGFEALKYILFLRGIFKTYRVRKPAGAEADHPLSEDGKRSIRDMLDYLTPCLRA
jgi:4-hydroxy-tetrahydrodipicolinate synthase